MVQFLKNVKLGGGKNTSIIVGKNSRLTNCRFYSDSSYNSIEIGDNVRMDGAEFDCWHGTVKIGNETTCGAVQFMVKEGSSINVGEDCMFSYNIKIFASDGHPYYNKINGKRLNPSKNVTIGDHVWIGNTAMILKGAKIPSNSIVGGGSVYTGSNTEEACIFAGNPAKCVSHQIRWERK